MATKKMKKPMTKKTPKKHSSVPKKQIAQSTTKAIPLQRPHYSFRLTKRREYHRLLNIPGYWALTREISQLLWGRKGMFFLLVLIYVLMTALLVGVASQSTFTSLSTTLQQPGNQLLSGGFGQVGNASLLFLAAVGGSLSSQSSDGSTTIYGVLMALLMWLTVVWLLRQQLASNKVRLRDGLYNAGAPMLSTFLVLLVMVVQLLPVGIAAIGYSAASASGLLAGGVEAMLFWFAAGLLVLLSLFWLTSSFFALIIVTIPGMYPFVALRQAGELVKGRRIRILLRLLWAALIIALAWTIIFIPLIMLDTWLNGALNWFSNIPLIPVILLIMSSLTLVWFSTYVYGLYRKVVDDVSQPA